jgi:hypothetical protein
MTGIPDELVLMGDNFESDPAIYLTLSKILREDSDPWVIWNSIKEQDIFQLKKKQNSQFLNKIYQLDNLLTRKRKEGGYHNPTKKIMIKIFIRKRFKTDELAPPEYFEKQKVYLDLIEMYDGLYQDEFDRLNNSQENSVNGADKTI